MRRVILTTLTVLLAGIALYSLAGFLLAPRLVERWIQAAAATEHGRRIAIERVEVNPYTLTVSFDNVTLYGPENLTLVSVANIDAGLDIESLIRPGWLFRNPVELNNIEIHARSTSTPVFTATGIAGTGVVVDAGRKSVSVAHAQIKNPHLRLDRDQAGRLEMSSWLYRLLFDPSSKATLIRNIEMIDGRAAYNDHSVSPSVGIGAERIDANITRLGQGRAMITAVSLHGQIGGAGAGELAAQWRPSVPDDTLNLHAAVRDFDLSILSPYVARFGGQGIASGNALLSLDVRRSKDYLDLDSHLVAEDLRLGDRIESESTEDLSLELALALLEDAHGRISIVSSERLNPADVDFNPEIFFAQTLRDAVSRLTTDPFDALAELVGRPGEDLDSLGFLPGSAEITPGTAERLNLLATALKQRPLLGLIVPPAYNPLADREALARQQMRLHVVLATSAGPPGQVDDKPLDMNDPKVQSVLDEFATTRLSNTQRDAIEVPQAGKNEAYYRSVFEALVVNHEVAESALTRLARYRAQSVEGELVRLGIGAERMQSGDAPEIVTGGQDIPSVSLHVLAAIAHALSSAQQ